jgi:hypothetical protein
MALAAITPPQDSQPALSTIDPRIQELEVPDAWEYEYSNTETDVRGFDPLFRTNLD